MQYEQSRPSNSIIREPLDTLSGYQMDYKRRNVPVNSCFARPTSTSNFNDSIGPGQDQMHQRHPTGNPITLLQQPSANWQVYEQRFITIQEQARLALQAGNLIQVQQFCAAATELHDRCSDERERCFAALEKARATSTHESTTKQVATLYTQYLNLFERTGYMIKILEQVSKSGDVSFESAIIVDPATAISNQIDEATIDE